MRLQYQARAEPVSTSGETITPDKWLGSSEVPRSAWARKVAIAAVVMAANTAFAYTPTPVINPDQWLPRLETPKWDIKRDQFKYPSLFYADIPRAESVSIDRWHPSIEVPRWDRKRNQYLYPATFLGDVPRAENVTIDRWHPEIEKPRWDRKRQQYTFPSDFLGDIPRAESVSVDRWHPSIEQPRITRPFRIYDSGAKDPYPIPNAAAVAFDWQIQNAEPFRPKPRIITGEQSFQIATFGELVTIDKWSPSAEQVRRAKSRPIFESGGTNPYPIPNVAATPFDWLIQNADPVRPKKRIITGEQAFQIASFGENVTIDKWHTLDNLPRWDAVRRQFQYPSLFFLFTPETVNIDKWEPQLRYRLWGRARQDYLYESFVGVVQVPQQTVTLDMWNPAQVYLRPLPIPLYWIQLGEVNMVVPGTHMPCILQANAILVQPVDYDATLIQPMGYCAEEIACE